MPQLSELPASLRRRISFGAHTQFYLLACVLALGFVLRAWDLRQPFAGDLSYNEVFYTTIARNFDSYGLLQQFNFGFGGADQAGAFFTREVRTSSPLIPWIIYGSDRLFGSSELAARLPFLFFAMTSLLLVFGITRHMYGATAALIATYIAAITPAIVFYSRAVQLDSPMFAFGLAALFTLMRFARRGRWGWLGASAACFGLALLAKYQAILFLPALVCAAAERDRPHSWRGRSLLAAAYLALSALPAAAWLGYTQLLPADPTADSLIAHLFNPVEWAPANWVTALAVTIENAPSYAGVFGYLFAILVTIIVLMRKTVTLGSQYRLVLLLSLPWFSQLLYPLNWANNPYYVYPVLYAVAIALGVAGTSLLQALSAVKLQGMRQLVLAVAIVSTVACVLDYREVFHGSYRPLAAATPNDPTVSARIVRTMNAADAPVLAELPQTLFYATDGQSNSVALPFGVGEGRAMYTAIASRHFSYVVFILTPPVDVIEALASRGYRRVGPVAWAAE